MTPSLVIGKLFLASAILAAAGTATASESPYAGMETRPVKALSDSDLADLRAGKGMRLALPGELNGYPGPRHVLDLADRLQLTDDQKKTVSALFAEMQTGARTLGHRVIEAERALDRAFAESRIDAAALDRLTADAAGRWAELRSHHLVYHLKTRALMTEQQVAAYNELRGYTGAAPTAPGQDTGHGTGHGHH